MSKINFHNVHTMIGADAEIEGPINLVEGIIIYGKVIGNVKTEGHVRVAKDAIVDGDIEGADIRVGGSVSGNIRSDGQVILGKNCILKGNIIYRKILIEDGAKFEGKCNILPQNSKSKEED